ncbi:MAG: hypothetical protein MZW92_38830 [Comamonadaceae bacterium]|nr:hypothetical protein [Comamonadaceae bacterium]
MTAPFSEHGRVRSIRTGRRCLHRQVPRFRSSFPSRWKATRRAPQSPRSTARCSTGARSRSTKSARARNATCRTAPSPPALQHSIGYRHGHAAKPGRSTPRAPRTARRPPARACAWSRTASQTSRRSPPPTAGAVAAGTATCSTTAPRSSPASVAARSRTSPRTPSSTPRSSASAPCMASRPGPRAARRSRPPAA